MDEHWIVRSMLLRIGRGMPASSPLARAIMEWAEPHADWLLAGMPRDEAPTAVGGDAATPALSDWPQLLARIEQAPGPGERMPHVLQLAQELAELLAFDSINAALLRLMVACDRLPRVETLVRIASRHGCDLPELLGALAGAPPGDAARVVRRSAVMRLGLVGFFANNRGEVLVDIRWPLERVLDRAPDARSELIDTLVGKRQAATLPLAAFAHVEHMDFLVRLLRGAVGARAPGVNVLIHGPPGTGKTELARTLAEAAGTALHSIGEADDDGEEPQRWERVAAMQLAQRLLGDSGGAVLLFDEMEDLIGDARPSQGDWFARREGSKVFVNRMLESNPVPVIWTTNAIGNVDDAILRRMSFVLNLELPSRNAALAMLERISNEEGVAPGDGIRRLVEQAPQASTVLRVASRAGRLAGEPDGGSRSAEALVRALAGELPLAGPGEPDLTLIEADRDVPALFAALRDTAALDVSLLLTGPPGTGKTALAHQLARTLDRPLIAKRASDLLSKWVGETESNIADAFAEARHRGGVLLLDEADSLFLDRRSARASWEVGQVNELLTWLDRHPLPVIAATNHGQALDPATLRRFVFKLELRPLGRERAARAFEHYFGMSAPTDLAELTNLTPGDFAVVARQLRHAPARGVVDLVDRLRAEAAVKPEVGRIGF